MSCGCEQPTPTCVNLCTDTNGCPVQLDTDCVLYHKDNSEISALTQLGITNGAPLESILEAIDVYIGQLKVSGYNLPFLRTLVTVNTLKNFAEAVDLYIQQASAAVSPFLGNVAVDPISPLDGQYWFNSTSGQLKIKVNGLVKVIQTV
jgi:hypothetical protein